ncbi:UNVERIFIED_CONTAM: hypothetical protein FKN15_005122 [Acipenser sinensis]
MEGFEEESVSGSESEGNDSVMSDGELQEAFAKGLLKPGLNIPLEARKKAVNDVEGLKQCLADFKKDLAWVERLDLASRPLPDIVAKADGKLTTLDSGEIHAEDDFQREMYFYRQAQAAVLEALPRLKKFNISTKRPEDYFAEMAKTDHHMQKARAITKLLAKQASMEKSEKAKQLRELRKYGKKDALEVLAENAEFSESEGRGLAFRKAGSVLRSLPFAVSRMEDLRGVPCLGEHTRKIIQEILEDGVSGKVEGVLRSERYRAMKALTGIFGVGVKTADRWAREGLRTPGDLLTSGHRLSREQEAGVRYYEDLNCPVTRAEADAIGEIVEEAVHSILPGGQVTLTGGFRR